MLKADVLNWENQKVSEITLKEAVFAQTVNTSLLHEVVCWQRAKARSGSHNTKTRSQVRGGGKKPFRQKGTGQARQGSIRSPLLKGGAVIHGPKPRNYGWALPKKPEKKPFARPFPISYQKKRLIFMENMTSKEGKTRELSRRFKKIGWDRALLVDTGTKEDTFQRACKNLKHFKLIRPEGFNVYDLLKFNRVALTPETLPALYKRCDIKEEK